MVLPLFGYYRKLSRATSQQAAEMLEGEHELPKSFVICRGNMKDFTFIRERYMRDELPIRLGGLAANLRRVQSFARNDANCDVVEGMLDESKHWSDRVLELSALMD